MIATPNPDGALPDPIRSLLNTFTEGVLLTDARKQIVFANERFCSVAAIASPAELLGRSIESLSIECAAENSEWPWDQAIRLDRSVSGRVLLRRGETGREEVLHFDITCKPLIGNEMVIMFDEVIATAKLSEAENASLHNLPPEIRKLRNAVLELTDVLHRGSVTDAEETLDCLSRIHRSGTQVLEKINDVLDLSKIESGHTQVRSIPVKIDAVIRDVVQMHQGGALDKAIALDLQFCTDLPTMMHCDPQFLGQIISRLLHNAIRFTEHGSVTVRAECVSLSSQHCEVGATPTPHRLLIHIDDTGIGMTDEQQEELFKAFAQTDTSPIGRLDATGLGVLICRRLVQAINGTLTVKSALGQGSTFTINLPVDCADLVDWTSCDVLSGRAHQSEQETPASEIQELPPKPVLVVDDGEANRRLIELVLTRAGANVVCAENGQEAIELITERSFSLVFMDMQMPVLDGMSATRQLRQSGCTLPIVALTGNAKESDRERCLDAGCDDFLSKPVNLDRLLECCQHHLSASNVVQLKKEREPLMVGCGEPTAFQAMANQTAGHAQHALRSDFAANDRPAREDAVDFVDRLEQSLEGVQATLAQASPIECTLPLDDEEYLAIVLDFVQRLDVRLMGMLSMLQRKAFDELEDEAHWLKGAGGTVGFAELTEPSRSLMIAARQQNVPRCQEALNGILSIRQRMALPRSK